MIFVDTNIQSYGEIYKSFRGFQTPLFNKKSEEECVSEFDQWMYNLINMPNMESMAFINQKKLFDQFDKIASYATLSDSDRRAYDADLKAYRDLRGQLEYAEEKGRKEGEAKGRKEGEEKGEAKMIREMARQGIGIDTIATIAKMTVDKIRRIIAAADDDA
ncbi:MAG: Rpn family recombination-promoting nuclease/putative transposase [Muribaculaceae bacterium]|nr:Rpn family recombination-promoting nuclease/putative transposase [Muribaculaceae bacterium]